VVFEPIGERHAIQNVTFTLMFDEAFTETDIGRISQGASSWISFLPKEERAQFVQMVFGEPPTGVTPPPPPVGIRYSRMNPDGTNDWLLSFNENQVSIQCFTYTRWDTVWGSAKSVLHDALKVISNGNRNLLHMNLQIIDVFEWTGNPADMSADKLFQTNGDFFPRTVDDFGSYWHLHNGYFQEIKFLSKGPLSKARTLNRIHVDAHTQNDRNLVIIDHALRTDTPLPTSAVADISETDYLDVVFSKLHTLNKLALAGLLTDEIQARIHLNG